MKKLLLIVFGIIGTFNLYAQGISVMGYGGALTGCRVYPLPGEYRVKGDWCYGAGLEVEMPFGSITLGWTGQQTVLRDETGSVPATDITDLAVNYYQLGFNKDLREGPVTPHTIFSLGAAQFVPSNTAITGDRWFFAATFGLGLKAEINEKVGVRIQAKGNMPLQMGGAGIFCGGGGCAPNIYFQPIIFQGEFTAGLAYKIK